MGVLEEYTGVHGSIRGVQRSTGEYMGVQGSIREVQGSTEEYGGV
jgi:hypothetical protein